MKDYSKLKKAELLEELQKVSETLETVSSVLAEKDADVGILRGELQEVREELSGFHNTCDSLMAEKSEWKSKFDTQYQELSEEISRTTEERDRIQEVEITEAQAIKGWKIIASLEALIIVILLVITLI